ncbi:MAG: prephenate dehydrogenase/arogenate dehydrogenase family protein, partial [Pseudomonadota bacterium]
MRHFPFSHIAIIGFGLIGSSIARAIKRHDQNIRITAHDPNLKASEFIRRHRLADQITLNAGECVKDAQLIIICTPVGAIEGICKTIAPYLKKGAIITDVGSIKQFVSTKMARFLPSHVYPIPAHPVAGTEKSGPEHGFAELFDQRFCILTPSSQTPVEKVAQLTLFWQYLGAYVESMSPKKHDDILALTSHLPHLLAYTMVHTLDQVEQKLLKSQKKSGDFSLKDSKVAKYSAGGFRDFTRIADSNPIMWRDIFLNNKKPILQSLQHFEEDLQTL